jgi:hypothetical protein
MSPLIDPDGVEIAAMRELVDFSWSGCFGGDLGVELEQATIASLTSHSR